MPEGCTRTCQSQRKHHHLLVMQVTLNSNEERVTVPLHLTVHACHSTNSAESSNQSAGAHHFSAAADVATIAASRSHHCRRQCHPLPWLRMLAYLLRSRSPHHEPTDASNAATAAADVEAWQQVQPEQRHHLAICSCRSYICSVCFWQLNVSCWSSNIGCWCRILLL